MTWRRVLVATALWAVPTSVAPSAPAQALECPDGIIVVVDPGPLGGGVTSRCVTTSPSNGVQALRDAGHRVDFVPGQPGFVCQIDVRPDPCNRAPAHAYWSYWYADQGGTWRYSNVGAGDPSTPRSNVEGWRFGDGSSPPSTPPPDGKPAPEPKPEPEPGPEPKPEAREDTSSSGGSSGGSSSGSSATGGSSSGGSSSGSSSNGSSTAPSSSSSAENGSTDQAPSDDEETSGERDTEDPEPSPEPDRSGSRNQLRERVELPEQATPAPTDEPEPNEAEPDTDDADDRAADEVVLPDRDDSAPPFGLITGGGLLAGLATLTALQVRRRRDLEG